MARHEGAPPDPKPVRLFAAVEIPPRARDTAARAIEDWRPRFPGARWVRPESWHVTVKFLGRTPPRLVRYVREGCASAAATIRPFRVRLGGLGVFPGPSRARVFWVGLDDEGSGLSALAAALDRELGDEFPPEKRRFTAHLTVARFNPPRDVREHAAALAEASVEPSPFRVGRLVLFQSHLSPRGARYEAVGEFPLRGSSKRKRAAKAARVIDSEQVFE